MLLPNLHTYPNLLMNAMNGRWGPSEPFESGAFFNQKGNGNLPIKYRMSHSKFKEISNAVRDLSDGGRQSVALIDGTDPLLLLESGLPPYFRYSPVIPNLVFTSQVESIIKRLDDDPPDHVVICTTAPSFFNVPATDSYDRLWQAVKERYTFEKEIAGMAMFRHAGREAPALAH
jgi:hypothetical protein